MVVDELFPTELCKRELYIALHLAFSYLVKLNGKNTTVFAMNKYLFKVLQNQVAIICYTKSTCTYRIHFMSDFDFLAFISNEFDLICYK